MTSNKLETLLLKKSQIEAQIKDAQAIEKTKTRKADTRARILLGGALISEVKKGQDNAEKILSYLFTKIANERDREFFLEWKKTQENINE